MEPGATRSGTVRFGVFEADLDSGELRKNGRKVRLQDQPFRVLALLLERSGEVVTREEIRQQLWGEDTFVDFDHSLNMAVKKIRAVLGDSANSPRFIETLPKRGYRFLLPVEGPPSAATPTQPAERPNRNPWYVGAAILAAVVIAGVWLGVRPEQAPMTEVPFTSYRGEELLPRISPDGTRVAFAADIEGNGNTDIYVRQIDGQGLQRLTTNPADEKNAVWSPDGSRIAFHRLLGRGPTLKAILEVPAVGGPERKLGDLAPGLWATKSGGLAWSPCGRFLAFSENERNRGVLSVRIFMLSTETLERWPISPPHSKPGEVDQLSWDIFPAFSPDGRTLAYARHRRGFAGIVYLVPINEDGSPGGTPIRLTSKGSHIAGLDWSPDGRSIIFSALREGGWSLWRVSADGGEAAPLEVGKRDAYNVSISREGDRLVYLAGHMTSDIWRGPGPYADESAKQAAPQRLISSTRADRQPSYSPDGTKIAFASDRTGNPEIWVCDSEGGNERQVTFLANHSQFPRWSPDGKQIAFMSREPGNMTIFVVSAEGGAPTRLTMGSEYNTFPSWSRDGRWIYFLTGRTKAWRTMKIPFEGGEPKFVTQIESTLALESPDGEHLFFSGVIGGGLLNESPGIWRTSPDGGEEVRILERHSRLFWAVLDEGICIENPDSTPRTLDFYRFDAETYETITDLPANAGNYLAVSPGGRWVLYERTEAEESDIVLVEDFR